MPVNAPPTLDNSLSRQVEPLPDHGPIGMYVCGPTVYARPHLGNARSIIIYDVLYRILLDYYGQDQVTYIRNITDVDDKINEAAKSRGITIAALTDEVTAQFHSDMDALGCLRPTIEPRATIHIPQMIGMIERLIEHGYAYVASGHVLFDIHSQPPHPHWHYGMLSGRAADEQEAGARVEVEAYKRHPGDFVLWKPADTDDDASSIFDSPWGAGRPGWHIECSAMATHYLGKSFTIHGGGADLKFPHHENEIAQSCCAYPDGEYARHWVHNGFLTAYGEKMSKSLGNVITVHDLLEQGIRPEVIRFALLSTHYSKPLDWNDKLLSDCQKQLDKLYGLIGRHDQRDDVQDAFRRALHDDMNTPKAMSLLHQMEPETLRASGQLLGLLQASPAQWAQAQPVDSRALNLSEAEIEALIEARRQAKREKNWPEADRIRDHLQGEGVKLVDKPGGVTEWQVI